MNIEAQRDLLRMRGFPNHHPLVKVYILNLKKFSSLQIVIVINNMYNYFQGEISIHPELVGHLHFGRYL